MANNLSNSVIEIWLQGGFVMPPLILLSVVLFTTLFRLVFELFHAARIEHPGFLPSPDERDSQDYRIDLELLAQQRLEWRLHFDRRLKFVRILTTAAPLLGLLGTVAGMLKTFSGLGLRAEVETIDLIASGISEALITTETGLSIAIVGLLLLCAVRGFRRRLLFRFERQEAVFALSQFNHPKEC
jgi:biopolymer transport protein ExbB